MHICIISQGYPYKDFAYYIFVQQLAETLADQGHKISVVAPQSITNKLIRKTPFAPFHRTDITSNGAEVEVYSPKIITLGKFEDKYAWLNQFQFSRLQKTISNTIEIFKTKPDIIYGHFWHMGYAGFKYAEKTNTPIFVASGEAEIELHKRFSLNVLKTFTEAVKGVICVSTKNKNESIEAQLTSGDRCIVLPNAINTNIFYKKDKIACRKKLGYPDNAFIIAFVGGFIPRKGPIRIVQAVKLLDDSDIRTIFIGRTMDADYSNLPKAEFNLFMDSVPHDQLVNYLNCADVFVMPTLHEGCCNSIIEAMACGLPIISSDREFNYDIVDKDCGILVDPMDITEIAAAIKTIKDNPNLKAKMSECALNKAKSLNIEARAKQISNFLHFKLNID